MKRSILLLVVTLAGGPALAEMPRYDPEAYCQRMSRQLGNSQDLLHDCLVQEQAAYDALKPTWDALPAAMRGYCDHMASTMGGSFDLLKDCVEQERSAAQSNQQFKFQR